MNPIFNETERLAIATAILRLIAADGKYEKNELRFLQDLYLDYGIPLIISNLGEVSYGDSKECLRQMSPDKKVIVRDILDRLAACDSNTDENEQAEINRVLS